MPDHPPWCKPAACTAYANPSPSLRRAHRGGIARIEVSRDGRRSTVTTMLIQDIGDGPKLVVTAAGWAHTRMVELGTAGMQQLIDNLTEQTAAARGVELDERLLVGPAHTAESTNDGPAA